MDQRQRDNDTDNDTVSPTKGNGNTRFGGHAAAFQVSVCGSPNLEVVRITCIAMTLEVAGRLTI